MKLFDQNKLENIEIKDNIFELDLHEMKIESIIFLINLFEDDIINEKY